VLFILSSSTETPSPSDIAARLHDISELCDNGKFSDAEHLCTLLLTHFPEAWSLNYNLGLILFHQNRYEEAINYYQKALAHDHTDSDLLFNYALCLSASGRLEDAVTIYKQAHMHSPDDVDICYNLAGCYHRLTILEKSRHWYEQVLRLNPNHASGLKNLGIVLLKLNDTISAHTCFTRLLALDPGDEGARHMVDALEGNVRQAAPAGYIKELFDDYAPHYEASMAEKLSYQVPVLLQVYLKQYVRFKRPLILDLGCGSGIIGQIVRQLYQCRLIGVDLSARMVELAALKNVYDQLIVAEIADFLRSTQSNHFDLIIAADVFNYVGALDTVLAEARRVSKTDGMLFFTVEHGIDQQADICLATTARFQHSMPYLRRVCELSGWQIEALDKVDLRLQGGTWVAGLMGVCTSVN
jgi:predicted TPR repeat methyltransferase